MSSEALARILGEEPLCVADAGASYFMPDTWNYLLPLVNARFVLFDPVAKNLVYAREIDAHRVTTIPIALSSHGRTSEFFLANVDSGSSLLPPHQWPGRPALEHDYFFPLTITDIETATLASCLDARHIDAVHAIKLDTQGSELDIIKGLDERRLETLLLVEMEVSLDSHPIYLGAARMPEVIEYFEQRGFRFVNIRIARKALEASGCVGPEFAATVPAHHECDVLFVRDIINGKFEDERQFMRVLRQHLTLLCAYYLHGEAIETVRLSAEIVPSERKVLAALEQAIGEFAEYQSVCLKSGAFSLWHRDRA
jgi:FkbM family methyltransferase